MSQDPRYTLAHHLRCYLEQTGQKQQVFAEAAGVNKAWVCAALNPLDYDDRRSAVPGALSEVLDILGLTFAPQEGEVPTVAQISEMIARMDAPIAAQSVAIAAVHAAGLMRDNQ